VSAADRLGYPHLGFLDDPTSKGNVLLKSMITMAHDLGLAVVAEGVADERDAEQLRGFGCEYAQSFHFGEPADAEASLKRLMERQPVPAS
jgi:EAL domain-containing protein (putative c-di-GMP-specific phosphodiesterase class I)